MSYNIDQFSKITGISKLVLRTWENRYDYLKAHRTPTNLRSYSDQLLIQALKTKFLIDAGYKISFITNQDSNEVDRLIESLKYSPNNTSSFSYYINKMIESGIKYDTDLFNNTYDECLLKFSYVDLYINIMIPTFSKIGLLWLTNRINPGQEHFLSEMFKQKLYAAIDQVKNKDNQSESWLLFLPPDEHHEIGLLFARFLLLKNGLNVIYLGANVPLSAIKKAYQTKQVDNILFFSISNLSKKKLTETVLFLSKYLGQTNRYLVTSVLGQQSLFKKNQINVINNLTKFIKLISN